MTFYEKLKNSIVVFDGAMGTEIHKLNPTNEEWQNMLGCSEILNLTIPDKIQKIHESYLEAGADVVETNTFGGNLIVLQEYGLENKLIEINENAVKIARSAAEKYSTKDKPRFVAGSMGPGSKIPTLGHITYDELYKSYTLQAEVLIKNKVDLFMIETCQDLLQIKACYNAVKDAQIKNNVDLPIVTSITIEQNGTMLIGSDTQTAVTVLKSIGVKIIGINCATGPDNMTQYVKQLASDFDGDILIMPNAGMPKNINGKLVYDLSFEAFAGKLKEFVVEYGVNIVGGCCGTSPDYIKALFDKVKDLKPKKRIVKNNPAAASLFQSQSLIQKPKPFYIGERANTNGSKKFRDMLLANNWDGVLDVIKDQEKNQAHALDLCVAYTGTDEMGNMKKAVKLIAKQAMLPLVIDSTNINVIEEALKCYGGKAIINSINLEDGFDKADRICKLAKRYGASLIALVIDEQGMAKEVDDKVKIAKRIYDIAVNKNGLKPEDLIYDALTFTLASGDEEMKNAGINTLEGIKQIKKELPGVFTVLGVSNISFGLKPYPREILNSVFLHEAVNAGLDLAIVNVKLILPLHKITKEDQELTLNLIYNKGKDPLFTFLKHFDQKTGEVKEKVSEENLTIDEKIKNRILDGSKAGLEELLKEKLKIDSAINIINNNLISAMKVVGELFGKGELQLPFVLQSAEVMKHAVDILKPFIEKKDNEIQRSIVLATVRGDVHDIGKNLVDIILSNNGYKVHNIGIKCEIETIYNKAIEVKADAIGMSGLLVKSTQVMKENIEFLKNKNCFIPVLLGGAALTPSYVYESCAAAIDSPVIYCANAFDGLKVMNAIKENKSHEFAKADSLKFLSRKKINPAVQAHENPDEKINYDIDIPNPPFFGNKIVTDINIDEVFGYLTEEVIFRGRWGYRRGVLSKEQYDKLIANEVKPKFEELKNFIKKENLFDLKLIYGYYQCNSKDNDLLIYKNNSNEILKKITYPRQNNKPNRSIADFFFPVDSGKKDLIAFQIVTIGSRARDWSNELYLKDKYKDYLLFHGIAVESAEALAEFNHKKIREELKITSEDGKDINDFVVQKYRGSRFSFGYPACPDLEGNKIIYDILEAHKIGIELTEDYQMVPEQTTSAFIAHHPQAKYFNIE